MATIATISKTHRSVASVTHIRFAIEGMKFSPEGFVLTVQEAVRVEYVTIVLRVSVMFVFGFIVAVRMRRSFVLF